MQNFEEYLYNSFEKYKEKSLKIRRFKQKDILPLIQKLPFENMVVGHSYEGREIIKVALGQGKRKILLWSQMHGNEATATMAIFAGIFRGTFYLQLLYIIYVLPVFPSSVFRVRWRVKPV